MDYTVKYILKTDNTAKCITCFNDHAECDPDDLTNKHPLMQKLMERGSVLLSSSPEYSSKICGYTGIRYVPDRIHIILYYSDMDPICNINYIGPIHCPSITDPTLIASGHQWSLSFEECLLDPKLSLANYLNKFINYDTITGPLVQCIIIQNPNSNSLTIFNAPLSKSYQSITNHCPNDCYPVNLQIGDQGRFYWLKKEAVLHSLITTDDLD